jgi:hemolysin activation/secretion protein
MGGKFLYWLEICLKLDMNVFTRRFAVSSLTALVAQVGLAADTYSGPSAGALMNHNEQTVRSHLPNNDQLRMLLLPPSMAISAQFRMVVRRVYFQGNKLLDKTQLYPSVQPFLNKPLGATELGQLTEAVTNRYRQSGWVIEVYIPQQALDQNELILQVVEDVRTSNKPQR